MLKKLAGLSGSAMLVALIGYFLAASPVADAARDGAGNYTLPVNSFSTPSPGTVISPTDATITFADWAAAFTDSLSRSGKGGMQADLDMGSHGLTNLTSATLANNASLRWLNLSAAPVKMLKYDSGGSLVFGEDIGAGGSYFYGASVAPISSGVTTLGLPSASWLNVYSFNLTLAGTTSGAGTLKPPAVASSYIWTLPAITGTLITADLTKTLTNTTYDTAGTGNAFSINGVAATANTGTGAVARATNPVFVGPALGTPASGVGTNLTGTAAGLTAGNVTTNANLTGDVTSVGNATTLTNAPVIAKVLTGFTSSPGTVTAADSILTAIQKVYGNDAQKLPLAGGTMSGNIAMGGNAITGGGAITGTTITGTSYVGLPTATTGVLGIVKPDGTTITVAGGIITASGGSATAVTPGTTSVSGGSANPGYALTNVAGTMVNSSLYSTAGGNINKFRNGGFTVWQRGTSVATTTGGVYTADGWIVSQAAAAFTCAQDVGNNGALYSIKCVGGTSNTGTNFTQRIESSMAAPLAGKTATVQFQYKQNTGGAITPLISSCYAGSTDTFGTCTSDLGSTSLTSCANNTWCTESYTFNVSANATAGYAVNIGCNTALTSAQSCWITAADIRVTPNVTVGVNANPPLPEFRPPSDELLLAQRYLPGWSWTGANMRLATGVVTTNQGYATLTYPTTARIAPTGLVSSGFATFAFGVDGLVADQTCTAVAAAFMSNIATRFNCTVSGTPFSSGNAGVLDTAAAGFLVLTGAEL